MFTSTLTRLFAALSLAAALTACGSNVETATPAPVLAAAISHMPVADCEPQACQGLRVIDGNVETFRADNARREALALAVARMDDGASPAQ
jgi:hypothetical protein